MNDDVARILKVAVPTSFLTISIDFSFHGKKFLLEILHNNNKKYYSTKSDVWSFGKCNSVTQTLPSQLVLIIIIIGMVLWEIFSLGAGNKNIMKFFFYLYINDHTFCLDPYCNLNSLEVIIKVKAQNTVLHQVTIHHNNNVFSHCN